VSGAVEANLIILPLMLFVLLVGLGTVALAAIARQLRRIADHLAGSTE